MPELLKSEALVIHSIRWHESSKIVTLYTREEGMVKAIARGALKPKSAFAGRLETLSLVRCVISQKAGRELQILTQADLLNPFLTLKTDLNKFPFAMAILELINKVFESGHKDEIFFEFLVKMLQAMEMSSNPLDVFLYFLLKLVSFLGFKPNFERCAVCGRSDFTQGGRFVFREGALYCTGCATPADVSVPLNAETIEFLRELQKFPHRRIQEFAKLPPENWDAISFLLRYLNFHLGREVRLESLRLLR